ncbi:MAG: hypothetical protein GTO41_26040 [Burkholderiales bacterium]|nr:hypothetical protein [Burkholderiales bacterium]
MSIEVLTDFFMWCTIITAGVYLVSVLFMLLAADFAYNVQTRWFPMTRETYNTIIYSLTGFFKIVFIVFVIVPYVSLLIVR